MSLINNIGIVKPYLKNNQIGDSKYSAYFDISNSQIIVNHFSYFSKIMGYIFLISIALLLVGFAYQDLIVMEDEPTFFGASNKQKFEVSITLGITLFASILSFIVYFTTSKKFIIFNRLQQTVQIPGMLWGKPFLVHFEELKVKMGYVGGNSSITYLAIQPPRKGFINPTNNIDLGTNTIQESWSFWLWYMDKNRPLPPSEALDEYREKDLDRLKKEGFPEPLYSCDYYYLDIDGVRYPTGNKCEGVWPPENE